MRSFALIAGLAALAVASPTPQVFDSDDLLDYPALPITDVPTGAGSEALPLNVAAVVAAAVADIIADPSPDVDANIPAVLERRSIEKRVPGDCAAQPLGAGPVPSPDDAETFKAYKPFEDAALAAKTPTGYVKSFTNKKASVSACNYMGYTPLESYDVDWAAAQCNAMAGCKSFNIFYERDPTVDPGEGCPDPASTTVIKASFWGNTIGEAVLTNYGETRKDFKVVIAGSNAYNLKECNTPIYGWTQKNLPDCAIQAPKTYCSGSRPDSYLTMKQFNDGVLDHNRCKAQCDIITKESPNTPCNFFTSYLQVLNDKCGVQQCAFYKRAYDEKYCTNKGQFRGTDKITIKWSSSFTNNAGDGVAMCPTTKPALF